MTLTIDPKSARRKKFAIELRVLENSPRVGGDQKLRIEFVSDSKLRIRKMFTKPRRGIDAHPQPDNRGLVPGTVCARTANWRWRISDCTKPPILLNKTLCPDRVGFAEIEHGKAELTPRPGT